MRTLPALCMIAFAALLGWLVLPTAWHSFEWTAAGNDPVALTQAGLDIALTPDRLRAEFDAALKSDDVDLAASFLALAAQEHIEVPADLQRRYTDATSGLQVARRFAWNGFVRGEGVGAAEATGMVTSDLVGIGDVRDLSGEGAKLLNGGSPDMVVMGLATAGLAVTAATWASFGGASPARVGLSTVKAAAKLGRLSRTLTAEIGALLAKAIDLAPLRAAVLALGRFDIEGARAALRAAVRPAELRQVAVLGEEVASISGQAGIRGAEETLAVARDTGEIERGARVAKVRGNATAAVLKLLGRGALTLAAVVWFVGTWAAAGFGYLWLLAVGVVILVRRLVRACWPKRRRPDVAAGSPRRNTARLSSLAASGRVPRRA